MKNFYTAFWTAACLLISSSGYAQSEWKNNFSDQEEILKTVGRGECSIADGVFRSKGSYACFGNPEDRIRKIDSMRGLTLLQIKDGKGLATVSTMCTEKADTDPIAGKLLVNMINELLK